MVVATTAASVGVTAGECDSTPHRSPDELVAKAIAPIKPQYLRPPPVRSGETRRSGVDNTGGGEVGKDKITGDGADSGLVKEKKSKRQLKRERKQVVMVILHIKYMVRDMGAMPERMN
jgi:tRNA-dihydrouridine synthase 3